MGTLSLCNIFYYMALSIRWKASLCSPDIEKNLIFGFTFVILRGIREAHSTNRTTILLCIPLDDVGSNPTFTNKVPAGEPNQTDKGHALC